MGREAVAAQRAGRVVACRVELGRLMYPAAIDHHDNLVVRCAEGRPPWRPLWAQRLGITARHNFSADGRGAIRDRSKDPEPHAARQTAPRARRPPGLALQGCLPFPLTLAQGAEREASPLGAAPPARPRPDNTPEAGCVWLAHNARAPAGLVGERGAGDRGLGAGGGGGSTSSGGAVDRSAGDPPAPGCLGGQSGRPISVGPQRERVACRRPLGDAALGRRRARLGHGGRPAPLVAVSRRSAKWVRHHRQSAV